MLWQNNFLVFSVIISVLIALLIFRLWDALVSRLNVNSFLGETEDDRKWLERMSIAVDWFSFNQNEMNKKLISAGIYSTWVARRYYLIKIIPFTMSLIVIVISFLKGYASLQLMIVSISVVAITFLIAPDIYVDALGKKRIRRISGRLPFLLDLMTMCVHTGMTIEATLEHLAKELVTVDRDLAYVVMKTVERARVIGIEKAIKEFYETVPTSEAQSFVMTLSQSLQYGSSVGPVLANLSAEIREINMMELEEKIGKLGAKMSIPLIIFIMVPIVVLIAAPGIMRMLG
ncbi:pilus assembly protein TadC [Photobacterium proteolyticum]|uniref:Pilus assembly protein TadC n=1 Tax=Photobacterium proteolyticum TaxID=1903952 RepID=A0A1Q9H1I8_9GAMM|nr:type II secretion system F family protein [Photobacterium proteolyticum]OLQ81642.1 pilus assembly protein TadC [Photobacterium proteolyticum]